MCLCINLFGLEKSNFFFVINFDNLKKSFLLIISNSNENKLKDQSVTALYMRSLVYEIKTILLIFC